MVEIRFLGLGGQRAMASAELTALAAIAQGKYAQAFPGIEPGKIGAQAAAYVRVSERPIRTRKKKLTPDVVVVLDPTLHRDVDVTAGLKRDGLVIMNTHKSVREVREETGLDTRLGVADASQTALEINSVPVGKTAILDTLIIASQGLPAESLCRPSESCFNPYLENDSAWNCAFEESHVGLQ
jgi:pyruvate ferredoxin oxidoreductase gamma subunit